MIIRTQNKNEIFIMTNAIFLRIETSRSIYSDKEYYIIARTINDRAIDLGKYPTEERALKILDEIEKVYVSVIGDFNQPKSYQMPQR